MSYGHIEIGKLRFEIESINLRDEVLHFWARAEVSKRKHIPTEGMMPYAIYGEDGKLFAVGKMDVTVFKYAHDHVGVWDTITMELPLAIVGGLAPVRDI